METLLQKWWSDCILAFTVTTMNETGGDDTSLSHFWSLPHFDFVFVFFCFFYLNGSLKEKRDWERRTWEEIKQGRCHCVADRCLLIVTLHRLNSQHRSQWPEDKVRITAFIYISNKNILNDETESKCVGKNKHYSVKLFLATFQSMPQSDGACCTDQVFFSLLFCPEPERHRICWEKHSTDDEATAHFSTGVRPTSGAIFSLRMSLKHEQVLLHTEKYHSVEQQKHAVWFTRTPELEFSTNGIPENR